jgi:plasmid maintenance system antidote protein VapI
MEKPTHPAQLLRRFIGEDKLISIEKASELLDCHQRTLEKLINFNEKKESNRGVGQELGWKMARLFNTDKEFWNDLQKTYDLWKEISKDEVESVMKFNDDDIDFIKLITNLHNKNEEAPHPAKIIKHLVGDDKKYTITEAGLITGIPRKTLSDFLQYDDYKKDNVSLSSKMAIKLGKSFDVEASFWVSLQVEYDRKNLKKNNDLGQDLLSFIKGMEEKEMTIKDEGPNLKSFLKGKSNSKRKI